MAALRIACSIARVPSTATVSTTACDPASAELTTSSPVATVKMVSPSLVVCTGLMARVRVVHHGGDLRGLGLRQRGVRDGATNGGVSRERVELCTRRLRGVCGIQHAVERLVGRKYANVRCTGASARGCVRARVRVRKPFRIAALCRHIGRHPRIVRSDLALHNARSRNRRSVFGNDMARGVHCHKCAHIELVALDGCVPQAGFHAELRAEQLAYRGARTRTRIALRHGTLVQTHGVFAGGIPHCDVGTHVRPANLQVEQRSATYQRHARHTHVEAETMLFQPPHHARRGVKPVCRAAREHDGVNLLHHVLGFEQIRLARGRASPAHVHARRSASLAQDDRAARGGVKVRRTADLHVLGNHGPCLSSETKQAQFTGIRQSACPP